MEEKRDLVGPIGIDEELLNNLMNEYLSLNEPMDRIDGNRAFVSKKRRDLYSTGETHSPKG